MMRRPLIRLRTSVAAATILLLWLLMMGLALLAVLSGKAAAHDALPTSAQPLGWSYPYACCSGIDCRQVPPAFIAEGAIGYTIETTGELVPYVGDSRLKPSPDGEFHWCSVAGADDSRTICLFASPRGM